MADQAKTVYNLVFKVAENEQRAALKAMESLTTESLRLHRENLATGESAQELGQRLENLMGAARGFDALTDGAGRLRLESLSTADALKEIYAASNTFDSAAANVKELTSSLKGAGAEASTLASRLDSADNEFDTLNRRVGFGGDVGSNLGSLRGITSTAGLGGGSQAIGVAADVISLTEELPRLAVALRQIPDVAKLAAQQIGLSGFGLVGGLIALSVAINELQKASAKHREEVQGLINAEREYNEFIVTATRESVDQRRVELEAQLEAERATYETAKEIQSAFNEGLEDKFSETGAAILGGIDKYTGAFGTIKEVNEQVDESGKKVGELEAELQKLNTAYESQQVILNEQRAALEASNAIGVKYYEEQFQLQLKTQELIKSGTTEQVNARLEAIRVESGALVTLLNNLSKFTEPTQEITDAIARYEAQLGSLNAEQLSLEAGILNLLQTRESEAESLDNLNKAYETHEKLVAQEIATTQERIQAEAEFNQFAREADTEAVQARLQALQDEKAGLEALLPTLERLAPTSETAAAELERVRQQLADVNANIGRTAGTGVDSARLNEQQAFTEDVLEIERDRDQQILEIRANTAAKEADLMRDLARNLADAEREASEARADASREYQQELADLEQDGQEQRADILKRFSRSAANAIGERDALAFKNAEQARDDDLSDLEESLASQRTELEQNYQQQLETLQIELTRQQEELRRKYAQQLQDLQRATQEQINAERLKAQQELTMRQQAYNQELALLTNFSQQGVSQMQYLATNGTLQMQQFTTNVLGMIGTLQAAAANLQIASAGSSAANISNTVYDILNDALSEVF